MEKLLHYTGFLLLGFILVYAPAVFAQGNVSSSGMKTSDDGTDYVLVGKAFHDIFSEPTKIDLNQNEIVYFQQELTVNNGTMTKYLAKFINQDSLGNSWFQFASYPTVTKGNAKITYTTDGINFSETLPKLNDLVGYKMEITQNIVHPSDGNNREADLLISFTMAPKKDYIIENNALDKDIVTFSGGYDSGGYGTYYDWGFRRGVHFTNIPVPGADVEVTYKDNDGIEIHDPQWIKGNVGDTYDTTTEQFKLEIPGYTLNQERFPINAIGNFTDKKQVVNYVYNKNPVKATSVTVKYQDVDGNKLADDVVKTGMIGEQYTTEQKEIPGYAFNDILGSAAGVFTDETQTVIYIYTQIPTKTAKVTVNYQDGAGNKLTDNVVKSGLVGEQYTTEQKGIPGYTFKEVHGNIKGRFTDNAQIVTYVYEKNKIQQPKDNQNNNNQALTKILPSTGENNSYSKVLGVLGSVIIICAITGWFMIKQKKDQE